MFFEDYHPGFDLSLSRPMRREDVSQDRPRPAMPWRQPFGRALAHAVLLLAAWQYRRSGVPPRPDWFDD